MELKGEKSKEAVNNYYQLAQSQYQLGRFTEAMSNSDFIMTGMQGIKTELGKNFSFVASLYYMQRAHVAFAMGSHNLAKTAVEKGIELIKEFKPSGPEQEKEVAIRQRDMLNLLTRVRAKLENRPVNELREEIATEQGLPTMFTNEYEKATEALETKFAEV